MISFWSATTTLLAGCLFLWLAIVLFLKYRHKYWSSKGFPQLPTNGLAGNTVFDKPIGIQFLEHYRNFKAMGAKIGGIYLFHLPSVVVVDLNLLKNIMVKDFDHFMDHSHGMAQDHDPLMGHLFNLEGEKWKQLRINMTPAFTSGKMKMMFQTFLKCSENLKNILDEHAEASEPVDVKLFLNRFTSDIIANCAFGLDVNLMKDPDTEFGKQAQKIFQKDSSEKYKILLLQLLPRTLYRWLNFRFIDKDLEDYFVSVVKDVVDYREKNEVYRKDFMHLLLQLKNRGKVSDDEKILDTDRQKQQPFLSLLELTAQCYVFFVAGFDTSSTTMSFALFELANNQEIQTKLRKDIDTVLERHGGELTYEAIMEMKYLDHVIQETLRKYPPVPMIPRVCTKDYKVPGTQMVIDKGTNVYIPVLGLHMDEQYYPDPEKYDPDRFTEESKAARPSMTWMPFGEGPRNCIGLRFGSLQSKVGLVTFIRNYNVTLNEKTDLPLIFDPSPFLLSVKNPIVLNINKL